MKGLYEITATKGGKSITSEVFGSMANKEQLFQLLMNRHNILHSERILWKMTSTNLIKQI